MNKSANAVCGLRPYTVQGIWDSKALAGNGLRTFSRIGILAVEVAESSGDYDRTVKAAHYAAADIPEYWLVDLSAELIDVFRQPEDDGYAERHRHRSGDTLSVSALPDVEAIPVEDVLGE